MLAWFGKPEIQNVAVESKHYSFMKTDHSLVAPELKPEQKPTASAVRYSCSEQPKVPLGIVVLIFAAVVSAIVVLYRIYGR